MIRILLSLLTVSAVLLSSQDCLAQFTGSQINAVSPGNLRVGGPFDFEVSYRFKAEYSGNLVGFKTYWTAKPRVSGYSRGNGGKFKITLQPDNGSSSHLPSGRTLATTYYDPSFSSKARSYTNFNYLRFSKPAYVQKGKIYHLKFENIDRSPKSNYMSLNALYMPSNGDASMPTTSSVDWGALVYTPGLPGVRRSVVKRHYIFYAPPAYIVSQSVSQINSCADTQPTFRKETNTVIIYSEKSQYYRSFPKITQAPATLGKITTLKLIFM